MHQVPNGLDVNFLKLSDGMSSGTKTLMKAGWYIDNNNVRVIQSMQNEDGIQKGVRTILKERGKHRNVQGHDLPLQCRYCKTKVTSEERALAISDEHLQENCCASHVLENEPDFLEQDEFASQAYSCMIC